MLNKYLKNIHMKGHQIISLPWTLTSLGLVLHQTKSETGPVQMKKEVFSQILVYIQSVKFHLNL
jgi:hypothetical protein